MFHPDKYENYAEPLRSQLVAEAVKEFKKLTRAYEVLRDPMSRAAHDRELARSGRGTFPSTRRTPTPRTATAEAPPRRARRTAPPPDGSPVESDPHLQVRPERLDFGIVSPGAVGQLSLRIENKGGRTLFGEVASDRSWVTVSDRNFISNHVVISVNLNTSGLHAGQNYAANITIKTLNGGDEVVPVVVRIAAIADPQLAGVPALIEFGEAERGKRKVRSITLTNSGTGLLSGSVKTLLPWLSTSERDFRGNTVSLDLIADTTGLIPGEHSGKVVFTSNGGHGIATVIVVVVAPVVGESLAPHVATEAPNRAPDQASEVGSPETVDPFPKNQQRDLLARIQRLEPETDWEGEFLVAIAQLVRAGRPLAGGELAKVYELEARAAGK
jgi:hypothetical protein